MLFSQTFALQQFLRHQHPESQHSPTSNKPLSGSMLANLSLLRGACLKSRHENSLVNNCSLTAGLKNVARILVTPRPLSCRVFTDSVHADKISFMMQEAPKHHATTCNQHVRITLEGVQLHAHANEGVWKIQSICVGRTGGDLGLTCWN